VFANHWDDRIGDFEERAMKNPQILDLTDEGDEEE